MPTLRSRRKRARDTSPSPFSPPWTPRVAQYGVGIHHNVAVPMSDGVELRVDIHYPTDRESGEPAAGPFPVLLSMTPYGKKAPPPAAQIGGGPTPYLIKRGYIEVMVDVRGCGVSGGSSQMFGDRQAQDGVELVDWASKLPNSNGGVGMFGVSYLASSRPLTQGALLGSHRALDPERTWYLPDGTVLKPHHISTRAAVEPVVPGELTRYDVEFLPTAALLETGHQLRLTVTTFDFPHLVPTAPARRALAGGSYRVHQGQPTPSHLLIPVAEPASLD